MRGQPRRAHGGDPRRGWPPPEDLDRNGEPSEEDERWDNVWLYVIVLAALAVIIGVELLFLFWIVLRDPTTMGMTYCRPVAAR